MELGNTKARVADGGRVVADWLYRIDKDPGAVCHAVKHCGLFSLLAKSRLHLEQRLRFDR
jgi:hypothetical protein